MRLHIIFTVGFVAALAACRSAERPIPTCRDLVCVVEKRARGRVFFEVVNASEADVTVRFEATIVGARSSIELPVVRVVAPHGKLQLTTLTPDSGVAWNYAGRFRYVFGSAWARHASNTLYALPYSAGEARQIMQGWHGRLTHTGVDDHAIDFEMPEQTAVRAAREGIVVVVKDDSVRRCADATCADDANYIMVRHDDGSVAEYGHLAHGGAHVRAGERVARAQVIAASGATGRVTAPHLHFVVRVAQSDATWRSVPVRFETARGVVEEPLAGAIYEAR
jgi:murein DD-endopeptidase MepM/ murein hydrolase activator NlpD